MATFRRFNYSNTDKASSYPAAWGDYKRGYKLRYKTYRPVKRYNIGYTQVSRGYTFAYKSGIIYGRYKFKYAQVSWKYRFRYKSGRILGCYRFRYGFYGEIYLEKPVIAFMYPSPEISVPFMTVDFMPPEREALAESYGRFLLSVTKSVLAGLDRLLAEHIDGKITAVQVNRLLEAVMRSTAASNGLYAAEIPQKSLLAYNLMLHMLEIPVKGLTRYSSETEIERKGRAELISLHNDVFALILKERLIAFESAVKGLNRDSCKQEIITGDESAVDRIKTGEITGSADNIFIAKTKKNIDVIACLALLLRASVKEAETESIELLSRLESEIFKSGTGCELGKATQDGLKESWCTAADKESKGSYIDIQGSSLINEAKEAFVYAAAGFYLSALKEIFNTDEILTEKDGKRYADIFHPVKKLDREAIKDCYAGIVLNWLERLAVRHITAQEPLAELDKSADKDVLSKTPESFLLRAAAGETEIDEEHTRLELAEDETKELLLEKIIAKLEKDSQGVDIEKVDLIVGRSCVIGLLTEVIEHLADVEKLILTEIMIKLLDNDSKPGFVETPQALSAITKELLPEITLIYAEKLSIDIEVEDDHELKLWQRFWFLYAGGITDEMILPCHDYPYEDEPITFEGFDDLMPENRQVTYPETFWKGVDHHPVHEGKNTGLKEIPLAINIMVDMINILTLMWYRFYPAFWGWTGTQAVLGITTEVYRWLTLETSISAQDEKGSRVHYDRCFRWLRWEAEKVSLLARNDMELRGNYYVGILLEEMINYMLDHHFNIMPVFEDVNKMDEWRRSFDRDLQHDITWVLDKVKGIRHKVIEGRSRKNNV